MERLEQQLRFILEADKLKFIKRQTYLSDGVRKENDAEHSWHLALMAVLLSEYANDPVDQLMVLKMVLIHDLVEIDAGDTYAYDDEGNATKREREIKAADRIFKLLPKDQAQEYRNIWEEFEEAKTSEARFAHVLDRMQPLLLNDATDGIAWREHQVFQEQIKSRNAMVREGSVPLYNKMMELVDKHVEKENIRR